MCSKFVCGWVGDDAETNRAPCGGGTTWHVKYVPRPWRETLDMLSTSNLQSLVAYAPYSTCIGPW